MIDLYCERTAYGFWNEPFNALSNLGFVAAAALALRTRHLRGNGDIGELVVIVLAALIGVGSFLFHTFANSWSELADVIPIWSFVAAYLFLIIYRLSAHDIVKSIAIGTVAALLLIMTSHFSGNDLATTNTLDSMPLNGSMQYAPALLALCLFAWLAWRRQHPVATDMLVATGLFILALLFRSIDHTSCALTQGIGTHFLWHLLIATMVGILLQALMLKLASPAPDSALASSNEPPGNPPPSH